MSQLRKILLVALMFAAAGAQAKRPHHGGPRDVPGQFDYYAVAMSWSPAFCSTGYDPQQCASGRQLGFVLHGLWPQHEQGYPQNCSTEKLPAQVRAQYASLFPSARLIAHEWPKHGSCSGLDPAAYFALSARLRDQLRIPAPYQRPVAPVRTSHQEFLQAFRAANPGMPQDGVLPFCTGGGRFLKEIHACYDKRGTSTSCSASEVRRSYNTCRQATFVLQSVR